MSVIYFYDDLMNGGKHSYLFDLENFNISVLIGRNRDKLGDYNIDDFPVDYYLDISKYLDSVIESLIPIGEDSEKYIKWFNFKMKIESYLKCQRL